MVMSRIWFTAARKKGGIVPVYSITSSARARKFGGNSIPVAFAVLGLMTNK